MNLRGFDPGGQRDWSRPRRCADSWTHSGCRPARIPAGLQAQAALYRSLLAGKRVLVVLDNARDAEQVRPLLPGSPGCLAIVTSRNQLTGLVAAEGAYPLTLDLLTAAEARDLLARRLGAGRVASEPDAVEEIIDRLRAAAAGAGHRRGPRRRQPGFPAGRRSPPSCARPPASSTRSTAAIWPPTCGRCSPGPTRR